MDEERANAVVDGAENALGFAILLGGVRTCETQYGAMGVKEGLVGGVVELTSVIGLESLNGARKFSANIGIKPSKEMMHFRFLLDRKSPSKMRKIIENNKIVLKTRQT